MGPLARLLLGLTMALASPASAQPSAARFSELGLPPAVSREAIESLLQRFVTRSYLKGFRHLGDERDFDHGHILYDASGRPLAILYHTQELALGRASGDDFAFIDPGARNWIQWFDDGRIENAARYLRRDYPHTPEWDWFRAAQLPALEQHRTILDKMLDPALLPVDAAKSLQLVFTRKDCEAAPPAADSKELRILLPTKEAVCLSLSAS